MKYLAIDAGWGGAAAYKIGKTLGVLDCPGDSAGIYEFLKNLMRRFGRDSWSIAIEANHCSPKFGAKGNFGLGMNIGSWEASLVAVGQDQWINVHPRTWKKVCSQERASTRKQREATKEKAWRFARRQYPSLRNMLGDQIPNVRAPEQGRADALCILHWVERDRKDEG